MKTIREITRFLLIAAVAGFEVLMMGEPQRSSRRSA
jgi:hypothetical protein